MKTPKMEIVPVSITERASKAVKEIMIRKKIPENYCLRIKLEDKINSCGANRFNLGFDLQDEKDLSYYTQGIRVIIKKTEVLHLAGQVLDHVTVDDVTGFAFEKET